MASSDPIENHVHPVPISQIRTGGDSVYISGQIGREADLSIPDSFERQARLALDDLMARLQEASLTPADVVRTTIYLTDRAHFDQMNAVYGEYFTDPFPTRTTMIVGLALPGLLFEIDAVAHRSGD